ncbi:UV radiation resistance-associated gene protein-like isoform X2 [Bolinopsis microptera]|uniref:UV radiation resistance-associated gene protein-like isoform X2 n=1 Tax=Bolinopsis microptera TaxID=2820187 RepID=UPI00307915DF
MNYNKKYAYSLSTQQFRARHVQGVQVKSLRDAARTHLSLLHPATKREVYRSSVYHESANPQWVLQNTLHAIQALRDLIVQVWDSDRNILLIEHFVTLSALSYFGEKGTESAWETNTVILVLNDSLFFSRHGRYPDIGPNVVLEEGDVKKPFCNVRKSDTRISYDTKTVQNLHAMYKSVIDAENTSVNLRAEIGRRIQSVSQVENNKVHELKCRIKYLQDRRAKFVESVTKDKDRLERMREQNAQHLLRRGNLRKSVRECGNLLAEELDKMDWMVRYVVKSKLKLLKRQQTLVGQLRQIFHITQDDKSHKMMIFGLKIHSQDQINDKSEEEELGPALGYAAHLVTLISSLFDVPLRFPLTPALSLSTIRDDITAKLDEKRVLPLYIKGKDRSYFSYGVFLLHRNIAQIRHHCGMRTEEIKAPLGNLTELMNSKLRDSMSCHPPARIVSNDKVISRHRSTDTFKKTHKRVRSAPIKFNVSLDMGGIDARSTYSNAPSEVSSWNSSISLKISEGPVQTASSAEDITVTVPEKEEEEVSDLIDFNEEELDDDEPGPSSTADSTTRPASSESAQTPEPQTPPTSPHTPLSSRVAWQDASPPDVFTSTDDVTANDKTSQETSVRTHNGSLSSSPMGSSTPPRGSTLPIGCSLTSGSTPPLSSSLNRSAEVGRSSFKSYIRGSELWGRTEDGAQRSASFKSYRHPKRTDTPKSDDRTDSLGAVSGDRSPIANRSPESLSSNRTPESVSSPSPESNRTDTGDTDSNVSQASSSIGSPSSQDSLNEKMFAYYLKYSSR